MWSIRLLQPLGGKCSVRSSYWSFYGHAFAGVPARSGRRLEHWVRDRVMNVAFYQAADRLPLGIAATLLYLGPFVVAAANTEIGWRLLLPVAALTGLALVSRPNGDADLGGIAVGLVAAGALAVYTVTPHRLGPDGGLDGLALAVTVSAVILSPLAATTAACPATNALADACGLWRGWSRCRLLVRLRRTQTRRRTDCLHTVRTRPSHRCPDRRRCPLSAVDRPDIGRDRRYRRRGCGDHRNAQQTCTPLLPASTSRASNGPCRCGAHAT